MKNHPLWDPQDAQKVSWKVDMTWAAAKDFIVGSSTSSLEQLPWRRSDPDAWAPPCLCFGKMSVLKKRTQFCLLSTTKVHISDHISDRIYEHISDDNHPDHLPSILSAICGLELTILSLRTIAQVGLAPPLHEFPHVSMLNARSMERATFFS